ncbi:zinc-dependent alcohol dehydrogenase family protein [uncultured Eudoraea sp.]|jgi:alcohol dehydrogenase|uniref:zinc-dependent alcohol dehydrogenase family protein n=1 Tax=uncultured Eudoraea sp. TaxID=1035614 RepID=UPI002628B720|nr:zinc-dependent alcohol dehydrogenase family protein [uncultured Eudoraea sp.]
MKVALYNAFQGPISIANVIDPNPSEFGVVIKVEASGLCLSDWHGWMGHDPDIVLPHVPGHELAGTIMSVGKKVKNWRAGQRVTVPFVGGCGSCTYCLEGNQQVCNFQFQPGFTAWGSFAEYVAIDYADINLVELPANMNFLEAAGLGCRFITAYRGVREQGKLTSDQTIAVHGCGGVGLSVIQIAKGIGAKVIAIDINVQKCNLAKDLGADYTINAATTNVVQAVKELSGGGVHVSVDALGHSITCINSIMGLRKRGKHIQIGLMTESHAAPPIPMANIVANELEILGSHGMQAHKYPEMFNFIDKAGINLGNMITKTISLQEVPVHLPKMHENSSSGITVVNSF